MTVKRTVFLAALALLAWPTGAGADDHKPPRAVMHGPQDQQQQGGLGGQLWFSPGDPCEEKPHGDVFGSPKGEPITVRAGKAMFVRFHTPSEPSSVTVHGRRGEVPYTLAPHAPQGDVRAWDARFAAPHFQRRNRSGIGVEGHWPVASCEGFDEWADWSFTVSKPR